MSGKFIVIEGLDGCGKTTQCERLAEKLKNDGRAVFLTREPTDSDCGRLLRQILGGKIAGTNQDMTVLFSADRLWHNLAENQIRDRLSRGEIVICDRYYYSTLAYQGLDGNLDFCKKLNIQCNNIQKPDICIFLETDTDICLDRIIQNRKSEDIEIFENRSMLEDIRCRFNKIFDMLDDENIVRIDAAGSIDDIAASIYNAVQEVIYDE